MTLEFRLDPLKRTTVIVASARARRPKVRGKSKKCPFDAGNETMTPPTRFAVKRNEKWRVRAFENKFPFLSQKVNFVNNKAYTGAFGVHEVIVETAKHGEQFENLNKEQAAAVFEAYVNRFEKIADAKGIQYAFLFKNHGKLGGASIGHEHSQIVGLPFIPEIPLAEFNYKGKCAYCSLTRKNVVFQNAEFAVIHPPFARFGLECWVIPKKHVASFTDFDKDTAAFFMEALQKIIRRIKRSTKDYNVVFHASCKKEKIHFHAEVYPHTATWAGIELGAGIIVNQTDEKTALAVLNRKI